MPNNIQLKAIISDARLISKNKFLAVQTAFGEDDSRVKAIQKDIKSVFRHFDDPRIWADPLTFDETKIAELVVKIDTVNPTDIDTYLSDTRTFLVYLSDKILAVPLKAINANLPANWNLRVLNALRLTSKNITNRKRFFKNQGIDLDQNEKFQKLSAKKKVLIKKYKLLLMSPDFESKETDKTILDKIGNAVQINTDVKKFIRLIQLLNKFITEKIKPAPQAESPTPPTPTPSS